MIKLVWSALEQSAIYRAFADIVGGEAFRRRLAAEWVRAKPGDRVLDIGCGPADWLELLGDVEYVGLDFNAKYIDAARARYGDRGRFEVASVSGDLVGSYRDFDMVLAMGVLHHLDDGEADDLLRMAASALRPGGRFIALDGVLTENQGAIERAIVLRDRGRFVRSADEYQRLAQARFGEIESRIYHGQLRIPYAHLAMSCRVG